MYSFLSLLKLHIVRRDIKEIYQKKNKISLNFLMFSVQMLHGNFTNGLPRMEALVRIANIPLVESGVRTAGRVYYDLKVFFLRNCLNEMK